ncbi:MAG: hypothetical protein WAM39_05850, partial [Bryobacteraceae bacterium]
MKPTISMIITATALCAVLATPARIMAQDEQENKAEGPPHYAVTDLGTFPGGTLSQAFQINNAGWVAGSSNLTAGGPQHAFLWYGTGPLKDLGTLGGPACPGCNSGADGPNLGGEAAIGSETSKLDPNGEDFCEFGTHRQCLGAIWKDDTLKALPTLPHANNDNAFGLNDEGQVVGFSENGIRDSCLNNGSSPVFRFEAVLWEPNGEIRELPPFPGDTVGFAFGINDHGQAVGSSGLCSNISLPPAVPNGPRAVLWESDGSPRDLGNLG